MLLMLTRLAIRLLATCKTPLFSPRTRGHQSHGSCAYVSHFGRQTTGFVGYCRLHHPNYQIGASTCAIVVPISCSFKVESHQTEPHRHTRPLASSLFSLVGIERSTELCATVANSSGRTPSCLLAALPSTISSRVHQFQFNPRAVRYWLKDGMPRHPFYSRDDDDDSNRTSLYIRRPLC